MGRHTAKNSYRDFHCAGRKGVSDVIATVLLVMITVALVFFVNNFFTGIASDAGSQTDKALLQNKMMSQKFMITTVYGCGGYICFELKALGTNELPIPMENAGYYINEAPKMVYPWPGESFGVDCVNNPILSPGQSCFGRLQGPCVAGQTLQVILSWGIRGFNTVSSCR